MVTAAVTLADLPLEHLSLYHVVDPYLSSILVFYGPVTTANATVSSSRVQAHIFTAAGFQSYSRITISPAAPLYAAVNHLPRDKQGDEMCRGLAVSMLKYFAELSQPLKDCLQDFASMEKPGGKIPRMFDEMHAADLANRMCKIESTPDVIRDIRSAFCERKVPWVDVDFVLPAGTIQAPTEHVDEDGSDFEETSAVQYGNYTALFCALGDPVFLPTSRLKRAPSQSTNLSKSRVFTRSQKESLRLAMCEMVDTEERYVAKLYTLVHVIADEFKTKARRRALSSTSPDESALEGLFPPCLNQILEVNAQFLEAIRQVLVETENHAMMDIAEDTELGSSGSRRISPRDFNDAIGAVAFANTLVEWFPLFSQPYAAYMRAHTGFTQTLNLFLRDKFSSFSARVYETGEQQLRSLLMEPVQRLPRYSLLIDAMTSSLPLVHPAVRSFLKARDIVKEICDLDESSSANHARSIQRLNELVGAWPTSITPTGRLINAVDFIELLPPFRTNALSSSGLGMGILLLYKNCIVLLTKRTGSTATARSLLAELDNAASAASSVGSCVQTAELNVTHVFDLDTVRCAQSTCGRVLFLTETSVTVNGQQFSGPSVLALELIAMYEGRASRLIEEIIKATIEGRFSEAERESGKWTLRSPPQTVGNLGILACVFEEEESPGNRTGMSRIRIVFETPRAICRKILETTEVEIIVSMFRVNEDQYRVDIESIFDSVSSDIVTVDSFVPVLSKRLLNLVTTLHGPRNKSLVAPFVHSNLEILRYLGQILIPVRPARVFRPPSPTKLLSSIWGGQTKESDTFLKEQSSATVLAGEFPRILPSLNNLSGAKNPSAAFPGGGDVTNTLLTTEVTAAEEQENDFAILEQVLSAYVLALQSRSGNIVGRTLRARGNVDRSSVNALYNVLLEDPGKIQAAAEVPVNVLFVAFETFMGNAWKKRMGPVLTPAALKLIQSSFDTMIPRVFDEQFRNCLAEMCSYNRAAFAAILRLLADLLEASGNDGDRGALTAAFAEMLVEEGDPMQHVSLLDRLVDDLDHLFDGFVPASLSFEDPPKKSNHQKSGSVSSNTSSFRKRFGFSLHRDTPKSDGGESKVSSILRTLSKTKSPGDPESSTPSTPRSFHLTRSKSIDVDTRLGPLLRPQSRDRTNTFLISDEQITRPERWQDESVSLSSIRGVINGAVVKVRRRRRSSLSDLRPQTASSDVSTESQSQDWRLVTPTAAANRPRSELMTPLSQARTKPNVMLPTPERTASTMDREYPVRLGSPLRKTTPSDPRSPSRKENIDPRLTLTERPAKQERSGSCDFPPLGLSGRSRENSIPTRGGGVKERPALPNSLDGKKPQPSGSPQKSQKARIQSAQKLRDRLQSAMKAQLSGQSSLKDDLKLIVSDVHALQHALHDRPTVATDRAAGVKAASSPLAEGAEIISRVQDLEAKFNVFASECNSRASALEKELESSLLVSEKRASRMGELYREASAENEALYSRFNSELSKLAKEVRTGNGEAALKAQLEAAFEEIGRLKKENFRLKREVGNLRAQQAAVALLKASEQ